MAKLGGIERRLFRAVLVVLAGCHPPATDVARPQPPIETVTPPEAEPPPPPPSQAETDPRAFCDAYRQLTTVDASQATAVVNHDGGDDFDGGWQRFTETARWDGQRGLATCQIIRDTTSQTVRVVHTVQCCRKRGPECGKSTARDVQARKLLVETVELQPDGTVATTRLAWVVEQPAQPRRHNCGRRPEGWVDDAIADGETGAELAAMAELEAASVPAFERLARELAHHGAPIALVRRARAAMRDEIRHARVITALAARHGAVPRTCELEPLPIRSLAEIAHENAVEGCVREAFGALVATHQAACAAPELREAFARIAADERRHAALAEDVHAWLSDRVDVDELAGVRAQAQAALRAGLFEAPSNAVLGLPPPDRAVALFDAYFG